MLRRSNIAKLVFMYPGTYTDLNSLKYFFPVTSPLAMYSVNSLKLKNLRCNDLEIQPLTDYHIRGHKVMTMVQWPSSSYAATLGEWEKWPHKRSGRAHVLVKLGFKKVGKYASGPPLLFSVQHILLTPPGIPSLFYVRHIL